MKKTLFILILSALSLTACHDRGTLGVNVVDSPDFPKLSQSSWEGVERIDDSTFVMRHRPTRTQYLILRTGRGTAAQIILDSDGRPYTR